MFKVAKHFGLKSLTNFDEAKAKLKQLFPYHWDFRGNEEAALPPK